MEDFATAALRHLESAEVLELEGRLDDAAYHFGLVGETALKAAVLGAIGGNAPVLPSRLKKHINHPQQSLQTAIARETQLIGLLCNGRLGGALLIEMQSGTLGTRFAGWSLDIRYADSNHCPVQLQDVHRWKLDAVTLYNAGTF